MMLLNAQLMMEEALQPEDHLAQVSVLPTGLRGELQCAPFQWTDC